MLIHKTTDYAIRMLCTLALAKQAVSSSKLAAQLGISSRYLLAIGSKLRKAGLVEVKSGSAGGYSFREDPGKITLLDVVSLTEEHLFTEFPKDEQRTPKLGTFYQETVELLKRQFERVTIQQLAAGESVC